jgi:hypothetical protein
VLAFRLTREAAANMLRQFQGQSLSSIGFDYDPHSATLSAETRLHKVVCTYLQAGLLLNHESTLPIGFGQCTYGEATQAIQSFINIAPVSAAVEP